MNDISLLCSLYMRVFSVLVCVWVCVFAVWDYLYMCCCCMCFAV